MRQNELLLLSLVLVLVGCQSQEVISLEKEERFTLNLGVLEDELDLFLRGGTAPPQETYLVLQDGMFFILNGSRAKLMEFTSFGDLLKIIFNPDLNPTPITLRVIESSDLVSNKVAIPFAFQSTGKFVVSPERDLYIEDRQSTMGRFGQQRGQGDSVILRFDRRGRYIDYIGQEGIAGTPFGFIHGLYTNEQGHLIVATRSSTELEVWVYDKAGDPVHQKKFDFAKLPIPDVYKDQAVQALFETMAYDWTKDWIYLYVSYLSPVLSDDSRVQVGVQIMSSWILTFDLTQDAYVDSFQAPRVVVQVQEGEVKRAQDRPLEFLGVTQGRDFCFLGLENPGLFRLIFTDARGDITEQRGLPIDLQDFKFYQFYLASNGTLGALLSDGKRVKAVWWRTDRLLGLFNAAPNF